MKKRHHPRPRIDDNGPLTTLFWVVVIAGLILPGFFGASDEGSEPPYTQHTTSRW